MRKRSSLDEPLSLREAAISQHRACRVSAFLALRALVSDTFHTGVKLQSLLIQTPAHL